MIPRNLVSSTAGIADPFRSQDKVRVLVHFVKPTEMHIYGSRAWKFKAIGVSPIREFV